MTNSMLAESYLEKAKARLKALKVLTDERAYSDVVREAQEIVELALKAMLREVGVEPPKIHDVGPLLLDNGSKFEQNVREHLETLAKISSWLRKEREFSFYGDIDFIPTDRYSLSDAEKAYHEASFVVETAGVALLGGRI